MILAAGLAVYFGALLLVLWLDPVGLNRPNTNEENDR